MLTPERGLPTQNMSHSLSDRAEQLILPPPPVPAGQTTRHYSAALPWLEFFLGVFGFHGLTYYALGKPMRATLWLAFDVLKHAIGAALIAATFFLALGCLIPLDIGISVFVTVHVSRTIHRAQHPHLAHPHTA